MSEDTGEVGISKTYLAVFGCTIIIIIFIVAAYINISDRVAANDTWRLKNAKETSNYYKLNCEENAKNLEAMIRWAQTQPNPPVLTVSPCNYLTTEPPLQER